MSVKEVYSQIPSLVDVHVALCISSGLFGSAMHRNQPFVVVRQSAELRGKVFCARHVLLGMTVGTLYDDNSGT